MVGQCELIWVGCLALGVSHAEPPQTSEMNLPWVVFVQPVLGTGELC